MNSIKVTRGISCLLSLILLTGLLSTLDFREFPVAQASPALSSCQVEPLQPDEGWVWGPPAKNHFSSPLWYERWVYTDHVLTPGPGAYVYNATTGERWDLVNPPPNSSQMSRLQAVSHPFYLGPLKIWETRGIPDNRFAIGVHFSWFAISPQTIFDIATTFLDSLANLNPVIPPIPPIPNHPDWRNHQWLLYYNCSQPPANTPTPAPSQPPTQLPSNGIALVNVPSVTVKPGQKFTASVTIQVTSGMLVANQDHLHATPEDASNTFGTYPNGAYPQQVVKTNVYPGQQYTFNDPSSFTMTAPNQTGTYYSVWQMRVGGNHIGPQAIIKVVVQQDPSTPQPDNSWSVDGGRTPILPAHLVSMSITSAPTSLRIGGLAVRVAVYPTTISA
jgi:hypothetical protein